MLKKDVAHAPPVESPTAPFPLRHRNRDPRLRSPEPKETCPSRLGTPK